MASLGKPNWEKTVEQIIKEEGYKEIEGGMIVEEVPFYSESGKLLYKDPRPVTFAGLDGGVVNGNYIPGEGGVKKANQSLRDIIWS